MKNNYNYLQGLDKSLNDYLNLMFGLYCLQYYILGIWQPHHYLFFKSQGLKIGSLFSRRMEGR